jgi:hypothetical protein
LPHIEEKSMACSGCRKGGGTRHTSGNGDLKKFAFLSSRQIKMLKEKEAQQQAESQEDKPDTEDN